MNIPIAYDPQVDDGHPFSNALCKRLVRVSGKPKKKRHFSGVTHDLRLVNVLMRSCAGGFAL